MIAADLRAAVMRGDIKYANTIASSKEDAALGLAKFILDEGMMDVKTMSDGTEIYRVWVVKPEAMK